MIVDRVGLGGWMDMILISERCRRRVKRRAGERMQLMDWMERMELGDEEREDVVALGLAFEWWWEKAVGGER